ncbi:MAG: sigma-54 dependent transcriptional regulator [Candidatus Alcyoniella australis]|nr:sigma-54 dependent transcriptional regulator [Candidatus Alcyoniella australis]
MSDRILVIDDETKWSKFLQELLSKQGYVVETQSNPLEAVTQVESERFDLVITDSNMPKLDGLSLLKRVKEVHPNLPVIVIGSFTTVTNAIEAMKEGAFDYITKPFDVEHMRNVVSKALERVHLIQENRFFRQQPAEPYSVEDIIGRSPQMKEIYKLIGKVAATNTPVLILGESGTGKELVAHAIHAHSNRTEKPFVVVNCSALPESLLESELFGHVKGSFTGAIADKKGLLEEADGGTLFLDEVGDIPLPIQVELLRFLQEGEVRRIGGNITRKVNVRIITATNQNLTELMEKKTFRMDLYYRLNVVTVNLPPLRDREGDIFYLTQYFIDKYNQIEKKNVQGIGNDAIALLNSYDWPGNVRELQNFIERAIALCQGDLITMQDMPPHLAQKPQAQIAQSSFAELKERTISEFEVRMLRHYLSLANGNVTKASKLADMPRQSFHRLISKYKLQFSE